MVLGVLSSGGDIMSQIFRKMDFRPNGKRHFEILSDQVIPWCRSITTGRDYNFQQDRTHPIPLQRADVTQNWLRLNFVGPKSSGQKHNGCAQARTLTL